MPNDDPAHRLLRADDWPEFRTMQSDQQKRVPAPLLEEPAPEGAPLIKLPAPASFTVGAMSLREAIAQRQTRRKFADAPLSLEELAFMCWATQGVRQVAPSGLALLRTVPSGGARHPYETYLFVHRVDGVARGLYRYLSISHQLCQLAAGDQREAAISACGGQRMAGECAVVFSWVAVPYRAAWRYPLVWPKLVAIDAGHICENLYLAAEACGCGCCAIGAYSQGVMDSTLGVDGVQQYCTYAAVVGKQA